MHSFFIKESEESEEWELSSELQGRLTAIANRHFDKRGNKKRDIFVSLRKNISFFMACLKGRQGLSAALAGADYMARVIHVDNYSPEAIVKIEEHLRAEGYTSFRFLDCGSKAVVIRAKHKSGKSRVVRIEKASYHQIKFNIPGGCFQYDRIDCEPVLQPYSSKIIDKDYKVEVMEEVSFLSKILDSQLSWDDKCIIRDFLVEKYKKMSDAEPINDNFADFNCGITSKGKPVVFDLM